jgi:hypothetical protein
LFVALGLFGGTRVTHAQCSFSSGSTGADGAFAPTSNVTVPLPPDGVLNYTTVDIPGGVTLTFKRNATNSPVILLASGDVTITGAVDVSGSAGVGFLAGAGGPGGFEGGWGGGSCGGAGAGNGIRFRSSE